MMVAAALCFGACDDGGGSKSGAGDSDPAAVSGLAAATAVDHVTLSWTDPVSFTLDRIEITWTPDAPYAVSVHPGVQTCQITLPADGTVRIFTVTSVFDDETTAAAAIETSGEAEIYTAADLDDMRDNLWAHYILMADIDLNGMAWSPIGTDASRFTGNLDGNCHSISNLTISSTADYQGLFGCIGPEGGVSDLRLENVSVSGASYVGALVGRSYGTIASCSATGIITGTGDYIGGLVGICDGTMTMCHAACVVSGNNYVGGFVGKNNGDVSNSYSAGPVNGRQYVGGFAGHIGNDGKAQNFNRCYATGDVTGSYNVGAFLGYNYDGVVTDCYATGAVTMTAAYLNGSFGGLIGYIQSNTVSRCYARGYVDADEAASVGGLIGNSDGTVTGCYYYQDPDNGIGTKADSNSMKQQSTYTGWDFGSTWRINANVNSGYPYLVTNPLAVNGLTARKIETSVVLTWADPQVDGFDHIEVTFEPGGSAVQEVPAGIGSYIAVVAVDGIARIFTVRAVYADGRCYDAAVVVSPNVINIATISGVTAPVLGEIPVTTITETEQYTGTVSWSPSHATFFSLTVYTATITLTAKSGYTLTGVAANFFTVAGTSTATTYSADSGVVTAVFPATEPPDLRDTGPAGGLIFHITDNGNGTYTYYEAAPADAGTTLQWLSTNTWLNGASVADGETQIVIGAGEYNTNRILHYKGERTASAAEYCDGLDVNGYSDWFLPSRDELNAMYNNLHQHGVGGFAPDFYWSSSEFSATAWLQSFDGGGQGNGLKDYPNRVRAVRAFIN